MVEAKMVMVNLEDEGDSKVLCLDMPKSGEYSQILYDSQEAGRYWDTDFAHATGANDKAWRGISNLMVKCIARGMRLASALKEVSSGTVGSLR